ncbi:hypothetical protein [Homoserinibacter sp. YIM 151385]|uniref:hypothetical protein n=1 Tax=Homoserinibacter sp. YIM 151385 TaxID=2985506 RepID=UPI0022F05D9A|nr:hypothetical protein [Homoserinibacter sp. YIM 151385]WBU38828.1 hypothetical protein OF852_04395 [Homoserinibacter sp. YIM 151385]
MGVVALTAVMGGIGIALGTMPPHETPTTASTAEPEPRTSRIPAPAPEPEEPGRELDAEESAAAKQAGAAVDDLLALGDAVAADPEAGPGDVGELADGFVRGEIEALAAERADLGYTQTGSARVTRIAVRDVDLDERPAAMTLDVCVDVSGIDVLDGAGRSLAEAMYRPNRPVLHRYGAQYLDGRWKLVTHELPDTESRNPNCS